jgi:hypothetical protein
MHQLFLEIFRPAPNGENLDMLSIEVTILAI